MAVGNLTNRHEFPQMGTNQGENNITAEEGGCSYLLSCRSGMPNFHTSIIDRREKHVHSLNG